MVNFFEDFAEYGCDFVCGNGVVEADFESVTVEIEVFSALKSVVGYVSVQNLDAALRTADEAFGAHREG